MQRTIIALKVDWACGAVIKSGPQWEPFLFLAIFEILISVITSELLQKVLKNTSFVKKWKKSPFLLLIRVSVLSVHEEHIYLS